jgi:hypothetical protein
MKSTAFKGDITTAYGKKLAKALNYSGSFDAYENIDEIRSEKDFPTDKEIVDFRNAERKANAVSQERNKVLEAAGIEKPQAKDPVVVYANFVKQLRLSGKSQKAADTMAVEILGYNADGYVVKDGVVTEEKAKAAEETTDSDE